LLPRGASQGSHGANDETEYRPTNHFEGAKQRELSAGLSGTSNEHLNDLAGRLSFSDAKAREMAGDNIFGQSPIDAVKVAAHNREVRNETHVGEQLGFEQWYAECGVFKCIDMGEDPICITLGDVQRCGEIFG